MKFIQASWGIACIKNLSDRCEKKKDGIYTSQHVDVSKANTLLGGKKKLHFAVFIESYRYFICHMLYYFVCGKSKPFPMRTNLFM